MEMMRQMMRLVVTDGTGSKAQANGYRVGGKTGSAEKAQGRGYNKKSLISSFAGIFPVDNPQYVVIAVMDEPKGTKETWGYATAGWTAAPIVGKVVSEIGPLLNVPARYDETLEATRRNLRINTEEGGRRLASF